MKKKGLRILLVCILVLSAAVCAYVLLNSPSKAAQITAGFSVPGSKQTNRQPQEVLVMNADFYVSPNGSDANDGSVSAPFASVEKARDAVRTLDKRGKTGVTVAFFAGHYAVRGIVFTAQDSGTADCPVTYCAYGDGKVTWNGGLSLTAADFQPVQDEAMRARLTAKAREAVVCTDLKTLGLTAADWGPINAIGAYNTAAKYTENRTGALYCELFYNDTAMTLARYPNEDWLYTGKVLEQGEGRERAGDRLYHNENWDTIRDPKSDTYKIDRSLAKRIASWQTMDDVWMFGYFMYDWADASTPIGTFDASSRTLSPKYVSFYGAKQDAPYYFFNIFEELDAPGEFYLDRNTGILYLFPGEDFQAARLNLSVTTDTIVRAEGASHLTFRDICIEGTRGDAMVLTGDNNLVERCLIQKVSGWGLRMTGHRNTARANEITRTGRGGIYLDGGERETLTPGENAAVDNVIHDWSRIYRTYQPAVFLDGVGNRCENNELYNAPHEAIQYTGNNHLIAYNSIHEVCLLSDDAGAIYSGRHWDWYGTAIRYNSIYNLGSGDHKPCGIYLDDALSGQEVTGNFLFNVPGIALHLGGGRDLNVKNNIIIDAGTAISYDERAREGATKPGSPWAEHWGEGGSVWKLLEASPWQSEVWRKAYPAYAHFSTDFNNPDSVEFGANPSYSQVTQNLIFGVDTDEQDDIGYIADSIFHYSTFKDNGVFPLEKAADFFTDPANGEYSLKDPQTLGFSFSPLPTAQIGRFARTNS